MASIPKIASKIGKRSALKKTAIAGGLLAAVGAGVAQGDPIQHSMNAAQEVAFGTDQIDNMILGADLRFRDFFPNVAGIGPGRTNALGLLNPKENAASMFSRRTFNKVPFNYSKINEEKNAQIAMQAAEYPFQEMGDEIRGYSQYAGSTFPQRSTTRSWDSASGDIVLGSYNLRRG